MREPGLPMLAPALRCGLHPFARCRKAGGNCVLQDGCVSAEEGQRPAMEWLHSGNRDTARVMDYGKETHVQF